MFSKILEWKAQRDFEHGFRRATQEREGVLDNGRLTAITEALKPIPKAIITAAAAGLVLEIIKMIFRIVY